MKHRMIAMVALAAATAFAAQAQEGGPMQHQHSPEMAAFCASHADDCAQLKQLHEAARATCSNAQSTVGACEQAREQVRAKMTALEAEGLPARQHGHGMGRQPPGDRFYNLRKLQRA